MRQPDVDWDEAARKAYHEMELQEDRDAFQRVLGVSDWQALKHDRLFRKHPALAFSGLLRHMVMTACRHECIMRDIPLHLLDDLRFDITERTEALCCEICQHHWKYGSPDELNAAIIAIAKAEAQKAEEER